MWDILEETCPEPDVMTQGTTAPSVRQYGILANPDRDLPPPSPLPLPGSFLKFTSQQSGSASLPPELSLGHEPEFVALRRGLAEAEGGPTVALPDDELLTLPHFLSASLLALRCSVSLLWNC